jgi:arylsulfatase A-like enzyme
VFLISIDTLRADHCGFHGYPRPTTPFLDELAGGGAVFESHMVNANNTLMSHASIMTGLVPLAHGAKDTGTPESRSVLRQGFRTLAEELAEAGFTTASFTTHATWLGRGFGMDQGFAEVQSDWIDAPANTRRFLDWYDEHEPQRLFAFLHYFDVHSDSYSIASDGDAHGSKLPYVSTPALVEQFAGEAPEGFTGCLATRPDCCSSQYLEAVSRGEEALSPEHLRYVVGLYDAGIRKLDDDLRALFAELERRDLLRGSLVVITSDHGEGFLEHASLLHSTYHDEIMHVPLIVLLPHGERPARARVAEVTRSIDLAPTILELCGLQPIGHGSSLVPCLRRGEAPSRNEVLFGPGVLRSRDHVSSFKFAFAKERADEAFFDLDQDPGERSNLLEDEAFASASSKRIERIRTTVKKLRDNALKIRASIPDDGVQIELTPEQRQRLEELGYGESAGGG